MVQLHYLFKKRANDDIDNMDFVRDPNPSGVLPSGLPTFREIDDPLFEPQTFSTTNYKQLNTNDIYGMHTSFLVRPGARKILQTHLQLVVKQKTNDFKIPSVAFAFLGIRPVNYDEANGTYTPLYDYFFIDRNSNMMCENSKIEFKDDSLGSVWETLNSVGVVPTAIEFAGGSPTYKTYPFNDSIFYTSWKHTSSVTLSSNVYTTHDLSSPILSHFPDTTNLPVGNALEAKFMYYALYPNYLDAASNNDNPVLTLLQSDDIESLTGYSTII